MARPKYKVINARKIALNGRRATHLDLFERKNGVYVHVWTGAVPGWVNSVLKSKAIKAYQQAEETQK